MSLAEASLVPPSRTEVMPAHSAGSALRRLAVLGGLLVVLTLGALALHVPGADSVGSLERTQVFVALVSVAAVAHFRAVAVVLRGVPTRAVWLIIVVAAVLRIGPLVAPPFLSSDVYRYAWDGRAQAAGINPYLFVPADPALAPLRDDSVFPLVNRKASPTIYPPAAQLVFAAIGVTAPGVAQVKVAMVGFEVIALSAATVVLLRLGLSPARIVVWAWNPLAVWAFAGNGHVDAAAAGLVAVALMLSGGGRSAAAGIAFGAAVLTKFLPLAVAPALWPRGRWKMAVAAVATMVGLYACYAGAGTRVLGFLSGYGAEEGLSDGSGFWLLAGVSHVVALPPWAAPVYVALAASVLTALGLWVAFVWRPRTDFEIWRAAGLLMAAVTVAISPHYSWYFPWLALPAIVAPSRALIWLSTAPLLLDLNPFDEHFGWASLVYLPAAALALADLRRPLVSPTPASGGAA